MWNDFATKKTITQSNFFFIMTLDHATPYTNGGESQVIEVTYTANSNNASGSYRIISNDADEPEIICETNGNINGANIGQEAPDFELDVMANGSGTFSLSDNLGKIIVIAFFAPN